MSNTSCPPIPEPRRWFGSSLFKSYANERGLQWNNGYLVRSKHKIKYGFEIISITDLECDSLSDIPKASLNFYFYRFCLSLHFSGSEWCWKVVKNNRLTFFGIFIDSLPKGYELCFIYKRYRKTYPFIFRTVYSANQFLNNNEKFVELSETELFSKMKPKLLKIQCPYRYVNYRTGEIINTTCDIYRSKYDELTYIGNKIIRKHEHHNIIVDFATEIGDDMSDWKGGTKSCTFSMLPGENWNDTIIRMQETKRF